MADPFRRPESDGPRGSKANVYVTFALLVVAVAIGVPILAIILSLRDALGGEQYPKVFFLLGAAVLGSIVNQPFRNQTDNEEKARCF